MAIRQPLSTGTSESCIIFYNGGHNHDGISSALINTAKYSIYDFTANFSSIESRRLVQEENFRVFTNVISEIVKTSVLGPSGITLRPNQVRAENISAGAVTATSLAANIVLVNNIISSNNYVTGVSGWAINSNGTAEFANTSIRGAIVANSVSTPGVDIFSNGTLAANSFTLYGNGAIVTSSGKFSVDADGNLFSNSATISGTVTASSVSTPGLDIDSNGNLQANNFALYSNGQISTPGVVISPTGSITANTFALYANGQITNGAFSVSSSGVLSATGATISGNVDASEVSTPGVNIDSAGNLTAPNFALYANGAIYGSGGNFQVNTSGALTATGATISGNISGSAISGSSLIVGSRIALPTDGSQILLGTATVSEATQVTIYSAGFQGMNVDTSNQGSCTFRGATWFINNNEFVAQRYITGLNSFTGSGTTLVVSGGEVLRLSSKRELKDNIQDFSNISLIDNLRPVTFTWKKSPRNNTETEDERLRRESSINIGFIAEEVAEASDGLLSIYNYEEGGDGEIEMYKYLDIIALSVANIQDLRKRVVELESRLAEIEG